MERQLRAWGLDVNAANVTLYTTLKASTNRVSAAMMRKQGMAVQSVLSQGTTLNTSYWLVPINEGQPLAPALAKYKVPPELVSEASEGQVDFSRWHILDKSCPREKLGLGVSEIVLHMKHDTRFIAGDSQATGAKAGDSEATGAKARGEGRPQARRQRPWKSVSSKPLPAPKPPWSLQRRAPCRRSQAKLRSAS